MKTPITYYGGKQKMLKHILPLIPEHKIYTESFGGGAALLFAKEPAVVNVINDLNGELVNFYRTLVSDYDALKKEVEQTLNCRGQHEVAWFIYQYPEYFDKVKRAWAVWVLSKLGFSGQLSSSFGITKSRNEKCTRLINAKSHFCDDLKTFLEHCTIENDDALSIIKRFDTEETLHFIDPPYIGSNMGHYKDMFNNGDFSELIVNLKTIKGRFILTMYPNNYLEKSIEDENWILYRLDRKATASRTTRPDREEWIVCNFMVEKDSGK
ncbi:MAG: DNA adenine methylase [Rikenellaceae bacterium]|nr:DNA adenine methylase [Rikenellaceae bacterium]